MNVAIVKYNAGNIHSVIHALRRLGVEPLLTDDPAQLAAAGKVIFPGVGEASTTMACLRASGLDQVIRSLRQPVLGICIGLQLMCRRSEEGNVDCLGIFDTEVRRFQSPDRAFKIPQMGWNTIEKLQGPLFAPDMEGAYVYYVHSYYAGLCPQTVATTTFSQPYSAALQRDNFYAVQFHPEKSSELGSRILRNFLELC